MEKPKYVVDNIIIKVFDLDSDMGTRVLQL
jgi:hypothetical protein